MSFTDEEKKAFERIAAVESYKLYAEYFFYIECGDSIRLGIKIYETDNGRFYSTQSHHLKTPTQAGPYHTSRAAQDTADLALSNGLDCMTCYIDSAVKAGHRPSPDWFISNKTY